MARRSYTDQQKRDALELYREHGPAEAARRTGIPSQTIATWAHRSPAEIISRQKTARASVESARLTWEERRLALISKLGLVADELIEAARTGELIVPAKDAQALLTAAGIAVDKAQLLSGGATSRSEVTNDDRRARAAQLLDDLAARRARRPAS